MSNRTFLRVLMGYVAGGHLFTGLFCMLGRKGIERIVAPLYGARFVPDAQLSHVARPAGAFVAGLGLMQLLAVRDPDRHGEVIDGTLVILFLRTLQRIVHRRDVTRIFNISPARHYLMTAHFGALALVLLLARLRETEAD
jgi:hypothetical protein